MTYYKEGYFKKSDVFNKNALWKGMAIYIYDSKEEEPRRIKKVDMVSEPRQFVINGRVNVEEDYDKVATGVYLIKDVEHTKLCLVDNNGRSYDFNIELFTGIEPRMTISVLSVEED